TQLGNDFETPACFDGRRTPKMEVAGSTPGRLLHQPFAPRERRPEKELTGSSRFMTLNLCLAGNSDIHMAADCRFTNTQTGQLHELMPKFVLVSYREWTGLISYAGI